MVCITPGARETSAVSWKPSRRQLDGDWRKPGIRTTAASLKILAKVRATASEVVAVKCDSTTPRLAREGNPIADRRSATWVTHRSAKAGADEAWGLIWRLTNACSVRRFSHLVIVVCVRRAFAHSAEEAILSEQRPKK